MNGRVGWKRASRSSNKTITSRLDARYIATAVTPYPHKDGQGKLGTIVIPVWVAIVGALLALWAVLDRLLVPSVRWVIRSRANKVLDEVSQRLRLQVRPFQQTSRRTLIDRLVFDERVQQAATAYAQANKMPRDVVHHMVERYAREIVPAFNAYFYFRIGAWLSRKVSRLLYRVRIGYSDEAGLAAVPPNATVVFVMNHRSNMDYILAAHLAAEQAALSYAVGEWARIWPLQQMIRAMGAYFVRRGSGNELYRRVLERYIAMATESGVTQAVYPEGGLTRDGRMREPKFGVLEYMLRGFTLDGERDLVFVPLGLNYDRVLEDRTQLLASSASAKKKSALTAAGNTLNFIFTQLGLALRSKWYRFGYACVNFGTPISTRSYCAQRGIDFRKLTKDDRIAEVSA
ncbi:MAG TPA: 1-acyl-sn-glycerol-3-phosphate acyltransferase, partial [Burkholderiaceae bacterium]|nr:1-acyl-sn-glycerol-3-phosphate acyltransferase [Burkholderiaceae bacterium]